MGLTIPFAFNIGPNSGANVDGVIHGVLPRVAPVSALSQVHLAPMTQVFRGNAATDGSITYTDVTDEANDDVAGDVSIFDTANPTQDILCVELEPGDVVSGISLLISTAAVIAGTPVADIRYRTTTGWANAVGVVTPSLTSIGLKKVTFLKSASPDVELGYNDITPIDHLIDPFTQPQMRCVFLRFTGITAVTTAPLFTRVWKNISHDTEHKSLDFTSLVAQGANPDFSGAQDTILPVDEDLTLFGWDEKPVRLFPTIYRPGDVAHVKEWVYSKADGSFAALPVADITDPSTLFTGGVPTPTPVDIVPGSFVGGAFTDLVAAPAGQTWITTTLASIALSGASLWGTFIADPTLAAAAVRYAGTNTELKNSNLETWYLWLLDGTFTKMVRLQFRITNSQLQYKADSWFFSGDKSAALAAGTTENVGATGTAWSTQTYATTNPDTGYGIAALTGTATPSAATTLHIPLIPPSEWGKASLTDTADVVHNRYWIGFRTTVDTASPILPANFTLRGQPMKGTGVEGIPAPETATYTKLTVIARDIASQESKLMVVNGTTGKAVSVTVPANDPLATANISLPVTKGDLLLLVQATGAGPSTLADGAVLLS